MVRRATSATSRSTTTSAPNSRCVSAAGWVRGGVRRGWALLRDLRAAGVPVESVADVVRLTREGHPEATRRYRRAAMILGTAVSDIVNVLNPRIVVIGGQLAEVDDVLFATVREVVYRRSLPLATRRLQIVPSRLGWERSASMVLPDSSSTTYTTRPALMAYLPAPNRASATTARIPQAAPKRGLGAEAGSDPGRSRARGRSMPGSAAAGRCPRREPAQLRWARRWPGHRRHRASGADRLAEALPPFPAIKVPVATSRPQAPWTSDPGGGDGAAQTVTERVRHLTVPQRRRGAVLHGRIIGSWTPWQRIRAASRIPPRSSSPHESRATSFLRPAVFGGSDGLVSNLALVMGVAGATADNQAIVIAGVAGLLAGAFSMAVGEYISVRSQHELFESQHRLQERQLAEDEAGERAALEGIYRERGFTPEEAGSIVATLFATPDRALEAMLRDEVGLDPRAIRRSVGRCQPAPSSRSCPARSSRSCPSCS